MFSTTYASGSDMIKFKIRSHVSKSDLNDPNPEPSHFKRKLKPKSNNLIDPIEIGDTFPMPKHTPHYAKHLKEEAKQKKKDKEQKEIYENSQNTPVVWDKPHRPFSHLTSLNKKSNTTSEPGSEVPVKNIPLHGSDVNNQYYDNHQYCSQEDKSKYLSSPQWSYLRELVFNRDGNKCLHCGSENELNCHHINYENLLDEKPSDLATLCNSCHSKLHKKLGYDRSTLYHIHHLKA